MSTLLSEKVPDWMRKAYHVHDSWSRGVAVAMTLWPPLCFITYTYKCSWWKRLRARLKGRNWWTYLKEEA
jgi:hypothetical protein